MKAKARKTKPVTSSQSWCKTRPKWLAVVRAPFTTALTVRFRPADCATTRARMVNRRTIESFVISVDFNSVRGYNDGHSGRRHEPGDAFRQLNGVWVEHGRHSTGGEVDQQLKQLMKELGEAINESLADSEQIAEVVSRIKDGGYDIFLVLEATIGVSKPGEKSNDKTSMVTTLTTNPEFKISDQDLKFLKSLRIKIENDAA